MAHTRVLSLLRHRRYRSFMDDLCAGSTQFQCVLLLLNFREHVILIRSDFFSETHPNYALYRHRLADGWFPGTEIVSFVPCAFPSRHSVHRFPTPYFRMA